MIVAVLALFGVILTISAMFIIRGQQATEVRRKERAELWAKIGEDVMALYWHQIRAQSLELHWKLGDEKRPDKWESFSKERRERLKLLVGLNLNAHILMLDRAMDRLIRGKDADDPDVKLDEVIALVGRKRSKEKLDRWCQLAMKGGEIMDMEPYVITS